MTDYEEDTVLSIDEFSAVVMAAEQTERYHLGIYQ
jgi:hypothetical protein